MLNGEERFINNIEHTIAGRGREKWDTEFNSRRCLVLNEEQMLVAANGLYIHFSNGLVSAISRMVPKTAPVCDTKFLTML